ncbi:MAG: F0F1 ATP synthase subunit A [Candidatus Bipolaricaulaceae bacterium]
MLETLGKKLILTFRIAGVDIAFDLAAMAAAVGVTGALVGLAVWLRRGLPADPEARPTRRATFLAAAADFAHTQLLGGFSPRLARALLPLVTTIFLYVLLCNWVSVLPIPYLVSPTQDLNVTLGLALLVYAMAHVYGAHERGLGKHLRSYLEPYPFLLPMNLVGDFGRTLSHAFRLFGNVLGGAILTAVITAKFAPVVLPVGLHMFFDLFVGGIQALVFALLASTYINIAVE